VSGSFVQAVLWEIKEGNTYEAVPNVDLVFATTLGSFKEPLTQTTDANGLVANHLISGAEEGSAVVTVATEDGGTSASLTVAIHAFAYFEDFSGAVGPEWSRQTKETVGTNPYLGKFTTEDVMLTLGGLSTSHGTVRLEFDTVLTGKWVGGGVWMQATAEDFQTQSSFCAFGEEAEAVETCDFSIKNHYLDNIAIKFYVDPSSWDQEHYTDPDDYGPHWWGLDNVRVELK